METKTNQTQIPLTLPGIWKRLGLSEERIEEICSSNNWEYPREKTKEATSKGKGHRGVITVRPTPENRFLLYVENKNATVNDIISAYQNCMRCKNRVENGE